MTNHKTRLELTWIGKDIRSKLEPRILLEDPAKSYHAKHRVTGNDFFDNRLIFGDKLLVLKNVGATNSHMESMPYIDLTKGRHSESGRAYFITTVLAERERRYFDDLTCARLVVIEMRGLHENGVVNSLAWVVMPDHVHWLFQLSETEGLSAVVKSFKAHCGKKRFTIMRCVKRKMCEALRVTLLPIRYGLGWLKILVIIHCGIPCGCRP